MNKQINADRWQFVPVPAFLTAVLCLLAAPLPSAGQYRPIDLPESLTFAEPTAAYDPRDPHRKLGDFQAGISVDVVQDAPGQSRWLVSYKRYGQPDVQGLIETPDLSAVHPEAYQRVRAGIEDFPLLQTLLEAPEPWPARPKEQANRIFDGEDNYITASGTGEAADILAAKEPEAFWGIQPLSTTVRYTDPGNPSVLVEVWNKGDAHRSRVRPARDRLRIREKLQEIQDAFPTQIKDPAPRLSITAIKIQEEVFLLPNDLRVSLRYKPGEYLLLRFQSIRRLQDNKPPAFDPDSFSRRIAAAVKTGEGGHRYIGSIPMIDQGKKGYCAAATLARVLQFYGYPIDMHAMADLAETEGRDGTLRDEIIRAMRRICTSTPFKLREVKDPDPGLLREKIEKGIPLIWFVPGHARLLIGMHPERNEIVFSDTWGPEYQYQIGDWVYFANYNREIWTLLPEGHK